MSGLESFPSHRTRCGAAVVFALSLSAAGCGTPEPKGVVQTVKMVDLLEIVPKAKVETEKPEQVQRIQLPVGGDTRPALFMHPTSRVIFPPVRLSLESRLELTMGVSELAWGEAGDGVQFSVYARPSGAERVRIFSTYLDPKHEQRDRRWVDAVVTLGIYAGRDVELTLETDPGPAGNLGWDWAGWGKAALVLGSD